jgi:acetolactate synthase-like protein
VHGGDLIAEILATHHVSHLFTLCGGHISPILVAAKNRGIRVVDTRHEASAVFAADAVARLTGRPGVAAVTAGPGVTNALTALQNAALAQSPLVLLGGAAATVLKGKGSLQDVDQLSLVRPVVKKALALRTSCDLLPMIENAFRIAASGVPGPVFVECPIDLLYPEELVRSWYGGSAAKPRAAGLRARLVQFYLKRHVDRMFACPWPDAPRGTSPAAVPCLPPRALEAVRGYLAQARRPVAVVGSQAVLFPDDAPALAQALDALGLPVYLTGMARGLLGPSHPRQMRHQRRQALQEADLVLLAGMACDFRLDYGRAINPQAHLIAFNRSRRDLRLNRRPTLALQTDPCRALCHLAPPVAPAPRWRPWLERLQQREAQREADIRSQAAAPVTGVNPLAFLLELERFLENDSLIVADGGDFVASAAYILRPRGPLGWMDPGVFGTLGAGAGFALGAALARPGHEIWILYGDGAAGYSLVEIDTFVRHGLPVIMVVGNDAGWSQIARDQVDYLGDDVATVLRPTAYEEVARGFGARGFGVHAPGDIAPALAAARETARTGTPALINVHLGRTDFRKGSISM